MVKLGGAGPQALLAAKGLLVGHLFDAPHPICPPYATLAPTEPLHPDRKGCNKLLVGVKGSYACFACVGYGAQSPHFLGI